MMTTTDQILAEVRKRTGMDFSRYRAATVQRRIANRMISLRIASWEDYLALVRSSPDEAERLLERIAIKVSRFYRNPEAFDRLRAELIPQLCGEAAGAPLRVWSAGCGNGEEAYTLAMLLDDAGNAGVVEATDIDPAALAAGEAGSYPVEAAEDLPLDLAARHLATVDDGARIRLQVSPALRARVRFARHDLLFAAAPSPSGFHLVSCRNVLIYLENEARREVLRVLQRALCPGGLLFLGEAEWPPDAMLDSLDVISQSERIFRARAQVAA